jgi:hypothetical protein
MRLCTYKQVFFGTIKSLPFPAYSPETIFTRLEARTATLFYHSHVASLMFLDPIR